MGRVLGVTIAGVLACGGDYYDSVHFNTNQPDFGALPRPLTITAWGQIDDRPVGYEPVAGWGNWDGDEEAYQKELARLTALLKDAQAALTSGDFVKAVVGELSRFLDRIEPAAAWAAR